MHGSNKSDEILRCVHCEYSTNFKSNLRKHIRIMHKREKKHLCDLCNLRFEFPNELKNHCEKVHEEIKDYKFSCDFCVKVFKYKSQLTTHKEYNHTIVGEKDSDTNQISKIPNQVEQIDCKTCSKRCLGSSLYIKHHQEIHGSIPVEYENKGGRHLFRPRL